MNDNVETTCWTSVDDVDQVDAGCSIYIYDRGQEAQLQHEFRLKRHEKLTGLRFDTASNFRCTSDRLFYAWQIIPYGRVRRECEKKRGGERERGDGGREKKGKSDERKIVLNFSTNDRRSNSNFTRNTVVTAIVSYPLNSQMSRRSLVE